MFGNGFSLLLSIATHFKPGCSPSCIDNILTNSTDLVVSSFHHCPVFCLVSTNKQNFLFFLTISMVLLQILILLLQN